MDLVCVYIVLVCVYIIYIFIIVNDIRWYFLGENLCILRELNPGRMLGRRACYHYTKDAIFGVLGLIKWVIEYPLLDFSCRGESNT